MKSLITICLWVVCTTMITAQRANYSRYDTFIYTNDNVEKQIQSRFNAASQGAAGNRNFMEDLGLATLNATKGIAGGYVSALIDLGVGTVASLVTKTANDKNKWEEIIRTENVYQERLATLEPINNFYSQSSFEGALDPLGMNFDGIGCLRTQDGDTVLYISCHVDPSKYNRIINHSKFELVLDTLIIAPTRLDLPNSFFNKEFSFEQRSNFQLSVQMKVFSSWMNSLPQMQKDQELGSFSLSVSVDQSELDSAGKLKYVRAEEQSAEQSSNYKITGESFIVPRSFMGYRDATGNYRNIWGTGEYKVEINLKQSCSITGAYRSMWKTDLKNRHASAKNDDLIEKTWKTISTQKWDEIGKRWVVTTLKAPADVINNELLDVLLLRPVKK